jgi:oligopeptide transport system substrate-binding protein
VIAAACGGATTSSAPPASTAPGTSTAPVTSAAPSAGAALAADQTLRIYVGATDPRSLNPQQASGSDEISVLGGLHRGLLYYDKDLNMVPALATALPVIADGGKTLTFTLKDGLKYSNGDPIVAADFVRSIRKLADPRAAYDYGYEACYIVGAKEVMGEDFGCVGAPTPYLDAEAGTFDNAVIDGLLAKLGVEAPDEKTVVVHLETPVVFINNLMAMWISYPTNEKNVKIEDGYDKGQYGEAADLITSGPFMMESWAHNSEMVLVQNPNWTAGPKPTLTKIVMTFGGDPEAAVASYERGDLDSVVVPGTSTRRVFEDPNLKDQIKDLPQLSIAYYDFATCQNPAKCPPSTTTADGHTPLANKNFRIALTRAVNKQELIELVYGGLGTPATGSVMPGIPGWPDDYDPYSYDVAAAQAAMATALTELGIKDRADDTDEVVTVQDVGKLKFGYNCDAGHTPRVNYLAGTWRANLGFSEAQFDISCTDFAVFRTERREGNKYDITRNGWGADFPHPDNQLRDLFLTGVGLNNSGYANPAFDALVAQASVEQDPAKSKDLYVQAQRLLVDDAPVVWLNWATTRYLVKPYLAGLVATASDHNNIGDVFYETMQILQH